MIRNQVGTVTHEGLESPLDSVCYRLYLMSFLTHLLRRRMNMNLILIDGGRLIVLR